MNEAWDGENALHNHIARPNPLFRALSEKIIITKVKV